MSVRFGFLRKLTQEQKRLYTIGTSVFVAGSAFKFAYFQFSRGIMVDDMDATHVRATKSLKESRKFAAWAEGDRTARTPELTRVQWAQLREYLELMAANNPDTYPVPPKA